MALSNLKPPTLRRVLGSPFKSPANVQNDKSSNLFSNSNPDSHASPTPKRNEERNTIFGPNDSIEEEDHSYDHKNTYNITDNVAEDVMCPICNEQMISLYQLNQHIDDEHNISETTPGAGEANEETNATVLPKVLSNEFINNDITKWFRKKPSQEIVTPVKRKTIKLDLIDNSKEFSLSDNITTNEGSLHDARSNASSPSMDKLRARVTRVHWKKPLTSQNVCTHPTCNKSLNVKNGIVNCRKCGDLFCNQHTYNKVKLRNSEDNKEPLYDTTKEGQWCRCCEKCYLAKPDLIEGTQSNVHDVTSIFLQKRQSYVDTKELVRNKIQKKFIKVVNLHADNFLSTRDKTILNNIRWLSLNNSKDSILESEQEIVGHDNWQIDAKITHCNICLTKFSMLIRKHHCRLCGKIVCDDSFGERSNCLIVVPLSKLLDKLVTLNYSPLVKLNLDDLLNTEDNRFSVRCCINCKNDLLHEWKLKSLKDSKEDGIFLVYTEILMTKRKIQAMIPRYKKLVTDPNNQATNKLRIKLMAFMKDFESLTILFKTKFFDKVNDRLAVKEAYLPYAKLINNIYQGCTIFLQETLVNVKVLNKEYKQQENKLLELMKPNEQSVATPKLTKKEIRELRESLMVMNEQKFLVETLIEQVTKQRRFDELTPLMENKSELSAAIKDLELKLGNDGF
ncbi:uncharacterized protein AC631_03576 [Debaryomyces fabryi]|uniref:FYVE-type domain-containing protein n=1 Tax=Debaryomyces fabryi TaxID=58627 RepID=A0A0V1PWT1_9ASCO|nr:uncharacterized protein AC631_03576 [Debaryomyces fabryi]KSA00640.1 hypothetical protein AC631_03576 [Debaryomyces fabryi]CUM45954.1 unnamed protein product [Debaryomyces fabryi]